MQRREDANTRAFIQRPSFTYKTVDAVVQGGGITERIPSGQYCHNDPRLQKEAKMKTLQMG
jgi:butyrate kinase